MFSPISARVKMLQAKRREIRAKIHRTLIVALIAPLFVAISAPTPALANTYAAGTSCSQFITGATAVTVTKVGDSCVIKFEASAANGTNSFTWTVPSNASSVSILVVAGGGSGGSRHAAGGGAGGFVYRTGVSVTPASTVAISVGKGGDSVTGALNGNVGAASSFATTSAAGGGFGGQTSAGGNGGSGGGGCCVSAAGSGNTPALTPSQGNNGGVGTQSSVEAGWSGGGGGGSGSTGFNSTSTSAIGGANTTSGTATGGAGGDGTINAITGSDVCYAAGGGGGVAASGANGGAGGKCGTTPVGGRGGKGTSSTDPNRALQGVDATGSGGGGGGFEGGTNQTSGRGGSGIVVVKYDLPVVTISANSGTGSPSATTLNVNSSNQVTLPTKSTLARDGYIFGGWNTAADGSGTNYAENVLFTPTGNITLHARWFPIATFNGNGHLTEASTVPNPVNVTSASANNALPIPYSLRKGLYRFGGWNANSTGTGTNTNGSNVDIYDLAEPYLRLEAANYNTSTNVWTATNGANVPASKVKSPANITKVTNIPTSGFGGTETFTAIRGTTAAGIALGNAELSNGFTFCAVARPTIVQTIGAANGGRIFDGVTGNWLAGWWGGYQGSFYHEGWMKDSTTTRNTNFHVLCDRPASNRFDGVQVGSAGSGSTRLPEMSINNGNLTGGSTITPTSNGETTPWEVAEIIVYDRTLVDADVLKVESYLKYRYGVTAATNASYTLGSATASYGTPAPQTVFAQWNSVISFDTNTATTGTAPANQTITGTGAALSGNSGSLAKGANAFLGWYTNKTESGGTFYAAGATYPNTGSKTLYAVYGPALSVSGGNTATFASGTGGKSETYTVSGGVGTRIVTSVVSPVNAGITLDSSVANSIVINVASTVAPGTYVDTITVRDDGFTTTKVITVTVATPILWSGSNPTSIQTTYGKQARVRLDFTGGASNKRVTLTHVSNPSSAAITIDTSTISSGFVTVLVDTSTAIGSYQESVTITDLTGVIRSTILSITVNKQATIAYPTASSVPSISRNGLIVRYEMDSATSYSGTGTTITDLEGRSNGIITGSTTYSRDFNGNIPLTGTQYIHMATGLNSSIIGETISVFMWVQPTGNGILLDERGQVGTGGVVSAGWRWAHIEVVAGAFKFRNYNGNTLTYTPPGLTAINTGWYYVGYTYNKSTLTLTAYVNGVAVETQTSFDRFAPYENGNVQYFGIGLDNAANMGNGSKGSFKFGAFHLYNTALSTTDVLNNYLVSKGRYTYLPSAGVLNLTTTAGINKDFSIFTGLDGVGNKTFTLSGLNSNFALETSTSNIATFKVLSTTAATSASSARTYSETLTATDLNGLNTTYSLTITANPVLLITTTSDTITTTFGRTGSTTLNVAANTGTGSSTFSRVSSSGSSAITATFTTGQAVLSVAATLPAGTYYETLTATDSLGATAFKVITIVVNPVLTLTSASSVNQIETTFSRGTSLTINVANGTGTRTAAALPVIVSGITMSTTNLQTGTLVINLTTAVAVGTYVETITVTDSVSASASLVITIIVNSAPTISFGGSLSGTVSFTTTQGGNVISNAFTAASGTGNKTLIISGTNAGISIDTSTANTAVLTFGPSLLSNSPSSARSYSETLTVTDSLGVTSIRVLTIQVNPPIILAANSTSIATTSGVETSTVITASRGSSTVTFTRTGTSTSGITLTAVANQATLRVLSTINPGTYYETVTATDTASATTSMMFTIVVAPPPSITGSAALISTAGYSFTSPTYSTSGGSGVITYLLVSPPTGVSLSASIGSPSIRVASSGISVGTYNLTLRATDAVSATTTFAVTLTVNGPVGLSGSPIVTKNYGISGTYIFETLEGTSPFTFSTTNICSTEVSTSGGITTEKIMGAGSCDWQVPAGVTTLTGVLAVGGGGGGGWGGLGGGGGAGEVESSTASISVTPGNKIAVTVGAGGEDGYAESESAWSCGANGQNSVFGTVTALGGGAGAGNAASGCTVNGNSGGSGGGGNASGTGGSSTKSTQTGWLAYGFAGGSGATSGGGGAGGAGIPKSATAGSKGKGGAGITLMGMTFAGGGGAYIDSQITAGDATGGSGGGGSSRAAGIGFLCTSCDATSGTGSGGGAGGRGGSGFIAIQYPTPTAETSTTAFTFQTISKGTPGLLRLTIPAGVPSDTYTATISVFQDTVSNNVIVSYPYSVVIRVNKGNPTLALSIPGGGSSATYGSPITISGSANTAGNFNFRKGGTTITGCGAKSTSSGVSTCTWTPTDTSTAVISAVFSPTDNSNWNTLTSSNLTLTVAQADTLTVTAGNITATYSEDGSGNPNTTVASPTFTLSGLASIDSITAMSYAYTGTQNNGSNYASNPIAPKVAGTYLITPATPVFTSPGTVNNYRNVTFAPGTLTINRKGRGSWTLTYGAGTNTITFGASKQETPTVTYPGDGNRSFTTTSNVCSVNASTGVITTLGVGSCAVTAVLSQTANWLSDTLTATVTINRGPRVATVTPASSTLRYGETTTVTSTVTQALDSATVTFSAGSFLGCAVDNVTGEVTGIRAGASCAVSVTYAQTALYESATASAAMTINKAMAPVVTTETITAISYTGNTALVTPRYRVSGILARDILQIVPLASVSNISLIDPATYSTVASYKYFATNPSSYDSTTAPSLGGTYAVTAQTLTLLSGVNISNYETPTYVSSNLVINPIIQTALRILLSAQESITVPYDITFAGGSSTGSITAAVISGGSATGCSVSGLRLSTATAGTCILQATKAADRNYLQVISETATVTILNFVSNIDFNALFDRGSGITITSQVPITVGAYTCSANCVPEITDVQDIGGNSTTTLTVLAPLRLIGVDLNTTDRVLFTARINGVRMSNVPAGSFQVDSPTQITVMPPASFVPNTGENSSSISVRIIVYSSGGSISTEKIVIISL